LTDTVANIISDVIQNEQNNRMIKKLLRTWYKWAREDLIGHRKHICTVICMLSCWIDFLRPHGCLFLKVKLEIVEPKIRGTQRRLPSKCFKNMFQANNGAFELALKMYF